VKDCPNCESRAFVVYLASLIVGMTFFGYVGLDTWLTNREPHVPCQGRTKNGVRAELYGPCFDTFSCAWRRF
jgi:hypothetical protein